MHCSKKTKIEERNLAPIPRLPKGLFITINTVYETGRQTK